MELIGPDWAGVFHQKGMRPYSQAVFWNEQNRQNLWRLGFLENSAASVVLSALERTKSLSLHQQGYDVGLGRIRCRSIPLDDRKIRPEPVPVGAEIRFLTTTSFKRSGAYVLFPEPELLYQSILQRWPMMTGEMPEKGLHQVLGYYTMIQDYDLHTEFSAWKGTASKGSSVQCGCVLAALNRCVRWQGFCLRAAVRPALVLRPPWAWVLHRFG